MTRSTSMKHVSFPPVTREESVRYPSLHRRVQPSERERERRRTTPLSIPCRSRRESRGRTPTRRRRPGGSEANGTTSDTGVGVAVIYAGCCRWRYRWYCVQQPTSYRIAGAVLVSFLVLEIRSLPTCELRKCSRRYGANVAFLINTTQ